MTPACLNCRVGKNACASRSVTISQTRFQVACRSFSMVEPMELRIPHNSFNLAGMVFFPVVVDAYQQNFPTTLHLLNIPLFFDLL